ncbi:ROK family protein [Cecembia lonarensis]|uniref:N-acetyl-D-glucosamine kinase n=1 Tax=Cecembia lonarensis (strain CCUG 58316 / KCTC 22772 / LW9) TaxID=1225176 RepID=K1LFF4_CECL9|nr:ROK family protein [Cecembia lonarensis]EKB49053.1 N-acetyl-D-glucosamine kinase [Cecembia lonarensis LW9]
MLTTSQTILGLDIGGTTMKAGVLVHGKLEDIRSIDTPSLESQECILETIVDFISNYLVYDFSAIGVGIPGLIDTEKGIVLNLANIPSFTKVHLKDFLQEKFNKPVFINNDANCFTLGEYKFGAAQIYNHVVGITLGTGVGTGIIMNGHLYCGHHCAAGEWCSVPYLEKDFEYYCSSKFFIRKYGKKPKSLYKKALQGDSIAIKAFEEFGFHLGELIKNVLYVLAPQAIVLGGSIRKAYPFFKESMLASISQFKYPSVSSNLNILISDLDETAIHGAVALVDEFYVAVKTV